MMPNHGIAEALQKAFPPDPFLPPEMALFLEQSLLARTPIRELTLHGSGYWYLATPYAKWVNGRDDAAAHAAALAGRILQSGVHVLSPIAHSHALVTAAPSLQMQDQHALWMPFDRLFVERAYGLLVADMDGWRDSVGVTDEIKWTLELRKPVYLVEPMDLTVRPLDPGADLL